MTQERRKQYKILIVDDNPQNIQLLGSVLREAGYLVGFATNGKQAIDILNKTSDFDLICLDIDMPILNGYETCKIIRQDEKLKELPIIFLTAYRDEEQIITGFECGGQDYVTKPFNPKELLSRINTHIQLKEKTEMLREINNRLEQIVEERTRELRIALEKAEEMNRVKSYFFANMSHEFRTPFIGIKGWAELLYEILPDPEHRHMVELILKSTERMLETLTKILNMTKLEFDKQELSMSYFDIRNLIEDTFNLLKATAEKKGLNYSMKIFGSKDYGTESLMIQSNENALKEILENLLSNAIKFTEKGSVELSAEIEERNNKEYLILKISDTGIGIPREKQEIIWQAFRQVSEGLNRNFEGTGLGLTITKKFVELLGGEIFLQSEVNKGSTFTVEIPINRVNQTKIISDFKKIEDIDEKGLIEAKLEKFTERKNILYVDDDETSLEFVNTLLSKYFTIHLAKNSKDVFETIKSKKFDAFLIDINLRTGLDGLELMEMLKKMPEYENTPMIAITAYAAQRDKEEFLSRGFTHYIAKPYSSKELLKSIAKIFSNE